MNKNFKIELAAFAKDLREMCKTHTCADCPIGDKNGVHVCRMTSDFFDLNKSLAAVEAYRKRKKPCAEVINKARDVYTIEVEMEIERNSWCANHSVDSCAENLRQDVWQYYSNNNVTVRVLSAERFVLESHRESDREDTE